MRYGTWTYNPKLLTLTNTENAYEIDLERIKTWTEFVLTLKQIHEKCWSTPEIVGDFVNAILSLRVI